MNASRPARPTKSTKQRAFAWTILRGPSAPLLAGFLAVMALMAIGFGIGIHEMRSLARTLDMEARESHLVRGALYTMARTARERVLLLAEVSSIEDAFERDTKLLRFDKLGGQFAQARATLLTFPLTPEEKALLERQALLVSGVMALLDQVIDLTHRDDLAAARRLLVGTAIPMQNQLIAVLDALVAARQERSQALTRQAQAQARQAIVIMLAGGGVAFALGLMATVRIYRWNERMIGELKGSETRLRAALIELGFQKQALDEHAIVSIADAEGRITYANDKFCQISGYRREELLGVNHRIVKSDRHPPEFYAQMWETIAAGKLWQGEVCNRNRKGDYYWVATTIMPFLDERGLPYQYVSLRTDITRMKLAEKELARRVAERTAELNHTKEDLERELAEHTQANMALERSYAELKTINGQLQEAQNQLLQSEKLASIGQLAAGVAHEINNPVGYVSSNLGTLEGYIRSLLELIEMYGLAEPAIQDAELAKRLHEAKARTDLDFLKEDVGALVSETRDGLTRVKQIVQDLKDFSRVDSADEWQQADLHQGLDSTLNIVWNEIKYKAKVDKRYGELPPVECLPSQLNQVFMNLLVNAAHAIEAHGTITLSSDRAGDYVWIKVADTGKGIAPENLNRVFDPFFTTKPVGKGTGLGLSLSYGIVQKHHGRIEVASELGKGTAFTVWLPVSQIEWRQQTETLGA
ncbi:MAG: PAS domain S-box protein [Betaproteobacteria bacterium]|nr:PAS domain S-box protein [Betaproteobacteria bacterium]